MRHRQRLPLLFGFALVLCVGSGLWACTDTNVYSETVEPNIPNKVTISGTVCTDDPAERQFPVRLMFIVDTSGSMAENDQELHRMTAVQDIVQRYNASDNYTFAIIKFAGEAFQLTEDGYTDWMDHLTEAIGGLGVSIRAPTAGAATTRPRCPWLRPYSPATC